MKFKIRLEEILIVIILISIIQGSFFVNATYGQFTYLSSQQFENQSALSKNNSRISGQNIVDPHFQNILILTWVLKQKTAITG
jgi:hypothetical protein